MRQFVPGPTVQDASGAFLAHPNERRYRPLVPGPVGLLMRVPVAPLLKMEGNAGVHTLIAEPADPVRMRGPSPTSIPRFAASRCLRRSRVYVASTSRSSTSSAVACSRSPSRNFCRRGNFSTLYRRHQPQHEAVHRLHRRTRPARTLPAVVRGRHYRDSWGAKPPRPPKM